MLESGIAPLAIPRGTDTHVGDRSKQKKNETTTTTTTTTKRSK